MIPDKIFILKFLKFCTVGFSGMVIDFGITRLLKEKAGINAYLANSCGFVFAAASNYILNRIWTFESRSEAVVVEYFSFFAIALAGLGLNNLFLWLFSDQLKWHFYPSKLFATGLVTLWNFGMNYFFTF